MTSARFITFEGGEGAGKTTQMRRLAEHLEAQGIRVVTTREPGGTPRAERIRKLLLSGSVQQLGPEGEALLFAAARADHVDRVIRPALRRGDWVISDRFLDSTRAYQGAGDGADLSLLRYLERLTVGHTMPNLTMILDLPVETGLRRAAERRAKAGETVPDRFEQSTVDRHQRRRQAFLEIARQEPLRCVVVDADHPEEEVAAAVRRVVGDRLLAVAA